MLLLDVDRFKRFNDSHGHKAGDLVLRLVGRLLAENVKERDTVARYGGEAFAVILAGAVVARQIGGAIEGKRLALAEKSKAAIGRRRPGQARRECGGTGRARGSGAVRGQAHG